MKIGVAGLWHLGTVTAACLAAAGHHVTAYDDNTQVVADLRRGALPVAEPGLDRLTAEGVDAGRLRFSHDAADLASSDLLWVCWDTPVDDNDVADVAFVTGRVLRILPSLPDGALVVISSQLPVGTTARLESAFRTLNSGVSLSFAYVPENLRLGKAIDVFRNADRIVAGVRSAQDRNRLDNLFRAFTERVEWMSVESAEMTKHALNAFLATSISFTNEIAALAERTGADAVEVERGLKSDARIGPGAYLHPGSAFAGGTLARDISFLLDLGAQLGAATHLLTGAQKSNNGHKDWAQRRLVELLGDLKSRTVAVLGLTYKPGTDTLRRSGAIEVCRWLAGRGATVRGYDPAVSRLPEDLAGILELTDSIAGALDGADAAYISVAWPEFRALAAETFIGGMRAPLVLDPSRILESTVGGDSRLQYVAIGKGL